MIRKFEKNDINPVMQIWKNENIKAHKFISKEYKEEINKKYEDENSTYNCDFFFFDPLPFVFICDNTVRNDTSYENICKRKNENIIEFTGCISG